VNASKQSSSFGKGGADNGQIKVSDFQIYRKRVKGVGGGGGGGGGGKWG